MVQTPQQRLANQKYAKREEKKHGKPESLTAKKDSPKPPISRGWIALFVFLVAGGLILEVLNLFFGH
ncbi:hypothetical protein V1514DRAFT_318797 [Lipomyces japonicus]|uniref:uncharacterized protein n=1 Tax=Lipomyces japonicus TaxID=56871 RepID=UPI0034CE9F5A